MYELPGRTDVSAVVIDSDEGANSLFLSTLDDETTYESYLEKKRLDNESAALYNKTLPDADPAAEAAAV